MTLKKFNALCSWLLTLALFAHLGTMSYSLLTGWYSYMLCKTLAFLTAGTAVLHIAVSLIILFFFTDGADLKHYQKRNLRVILQRASGLVIIALLHLHVNAFGFIASGTALSGSAKAGVLITELLFFGAIFTHLAVSFSRSLISLGLLRSEAAEKAIDGIAEILSAVLFLITSAALLRFLLSWG